MCKVMFICVRDTVESYGPLATDLPVNFGELLDLVLCYRVGVVGFITVEP